MKDSISYGEQREVDGKEQTTIIAQHIDGNEKLQ